MSGKLSRHFSSSFSSFCWFCYTPDIRNIRAPLQIFGDRVKIDKESREKQDWDGSNGSNKRGDLDRDEKHTLSREEEEIYKVRSCNTCSEVEAAPTSKPRDWATRAVQVDRAMKSRYRLTSGGCSVIQYTILQYMIGQITWQTQLTQLKLTEANNQDLCFKWC